MCRAISSGVVQLASIVLLLSGLAVAVVGIVAYVELDKLSSFGLPALTFPIVLMGVGLAVCIVAVLLCCAARKQNRCLLLLMFVLLVGLFIAQAVLAGLVFHASQDASKLLTKGWNALPQTGQKQIEKQFACCGWGNQTADCVTASQAGQQEQPAAEPASQAGQQEQLAAEPASQAGQQEQLAAEPASQAGQQEQLAAEPASQTCKTVVTDYFKKYLNQIAITSAVVLVVEAIVGVAMLCLICSSKKHDDYEQH